MYDKIAELCDRNNVSGYRLCKDIGIQPSIITDLKKGRQKGLSATNAEKVASYFGVSVAYLLGEENEKPTVLADDGLTDSQKALIELAQGLTEPEAEQILQTVKLILQGLRK